jgi:hypothetical protein
MAILNGCYAGIVNGGLSQLHTEATPSISQRDVVRILLSASTAHFCNLLISEMQIALLQLGR